SHQYFDYRLQSIHIQYGETLTDIVNSDEVTRRRKEREDFIELHYALGGLLLYSKQYETIKFILSYTQSSPPNYVLLPSSMTQIFELFQEFQHGNHGRIGGVGMKYSYPELDIITQDNEVTHWMNLFLALLFVRQYTLIRHYTFNN